MATINRKMLLRALRSIQKLRPESLRMAAGRRHVTVAAADWAAKVHRAMAKRGNRRCGPLARRWFGIAQRGIGQGTVFYLTAAYKLASRR